VVFYKICDAFFFFWVEKCTSHPAEGYESLTEGQSTFCCGQIRVIDRNCEIPHEGPFCDLMWSDPEEIDTWAVSPRGAGWLFGTRVTQEVRK